MPAIRRRDSETTHVSDSEPEREAARSRAHKTRTSRSRTSTSSARRQAHRQARTPLSDSSNIQECHEPTAIEPYFGLEARLLNIESEIAHLRVALKIPTNTPTSRRAQLFLQMTDLDAIREAMALIRMTVNQYDTEISKRIAELAEHADVSPNDIQEVPDTADKDHWRLGSPQNLVNSRFAMQDAVWINDSTRRNFHSDLRTFIRNAFPDEPLREDGEETIMIRPFRCIYLHYTSLEDWTDQCDVLRCNPSFQINHEERFDCVAVNMDDDPLTFGRMLFLFQCRFPSGRTEDMALVRLFKKSSWRPKTLWKNCRIFEDSRTIFILPRYFVRGAHMVNCFGCTKEDRTFYLDDVADFDWLLRAGN